MHDLGLILTLATSLTAALVFGFITHRLKLSPILGYLVAGVVVGPYTPGLVADTNSASQLAEIGVVLLMFGVGLHFRLTDLLSVRSIAIPGAIGQTMVATLLGTGLAMLLGWNRGAGLVLGLGVSVASTVVLMRVLMDNKQLDTQQGRVAVGWLVVEDLLTVLVLVLLPAMVKVFRGDQAVGWGMFLSLGFALLKVALLVFIVLLGGKRFIPWLLTCAARTGSRELFTLTILVVALGIATGSAIFFGVSMALGAFLAGTVVGQSELSHQAGADALPLRDAFAVLFFVSVGMLFAPTFILQHPALVLGTLAIVLVGKPLVALILVLALGHSFRTALTVAIALAQIGEFSFILAELGRKLEIFPEEGQSALIAAAMISIALNPLIFRAIKPLERWLEGHQRLWRLLNGRLVRQIEQINLATSQHLSNPSSLPRAVVVGFGPVGQTLHRVLGEFELNPVVIDLNVETVQALAQRKVPALYGDATRIEILKAAGVPTADYLLVTVPDFASRFPIIIAAKGLNPRLRVFVRAHYAGERTMLEEVGATEVCYEEVEAAAALAELLLRDIGADQTRIDSETQKIRAELSLRNRNQAEPPD